MLDPAVEEAIAKHDCTLYFSRIGDQDRFGTQKPGKRGVMCYARDINALASSYGSTSYSAFMAVKNAINEVLCSAKHIQISCPLGTLFSGSASGVRDQITSDVSISRFPLGVPIPLPASGFSGRIAITHYLTPTGSKPYQPASVALDKVSFAEIENGRIIRFTGDRDETRLIEAHYDNVASQFGLDPDIIHSWHAGIHPGSHYTASAAKDPDRWSNSVFTNPRFVHFHTCGNYAPGEISLMVLDPSICLDGKNLWERGRLNMAVFDQTRQCLEQWPELKTLFQQPSQAIGL